MSYHSADNECPLRVFSGTITMVVKPMCASQGNCYFGSCSGLNGINKIGSVRFAGGGGHFGGGLLGMFFDSMELYS